MRAAMVPADGRAGPVSRFDTPARDREAFLTRLAGICDAEPVRPAAVAISLAGVVNPETGRMIVANIPAIHGTDLSGDLATRLGIPVFVANDADCFAVAEAVSGAGQGHDIVFGIILGTGVGGGLVTGGRLVNARGGFAGEWGHGPVAALRGGTPPVEVPHFACGCGLSGCLDTVAGARGIERLHAHLSGEDKSSHAILEDWRAGLPAATRTLDVYLDIIAGPLALTVNITGATIVPAGGGLARDHALVAAIDAAVRPLTLWQFDRPLVVPATSGEEPGLTGAGIIGLQKLSEG